MALWQILLTTSVLTLAGAGVLYIREKKGDSDTPDRSEVQMPAFSLLGNSAKEYNAREVHIPESKTPVHIIRQRGNDYEELPLTSDAVTEVTLNEKQTAGDREGSSTPPPKEQKKKDSDWTPIDFFGDEKQ